jgi:uncharacterized protein YqgC (DUF456 family)
VTEIWDKAMKDLMAGKINGGSIGAGVGGVVGGIVGSVGGLPGIIIGAMVGSAVGAILGNFVEKKWEASSESMKTLMIWGKVMTWQINKKMASLIRWDAIQMII